MSWTAHRRIGCDADGLSEADRGVDLRTIREILGHESLNTTSLCLHDEEDKRHREALKLHGMNRAGACSAVGCSGSYPSALGAERGLLHAVENTFLASDPASTGGVTRIAPGDDATGQTVTAGESDVPGTEPDEDIPDEEMPAGPSPGDTPPDEEAPQGDAPQ
ncbi:hypothetical protein P0D69_41250 [Paraburkholderia sediminicola]|uniref:hypothetical protein n=1 Tax=Paraburkholderia sediminicola TaxID=458836 RepID=UPI0038BB71E6